LLKDIDMGLLADTLNDSSFQQGRGSDPVEATWIKSELQICY